MITDYIFFPAIFSLIPFCWVIFAFLDIFFFPKCIYFGLDCQSCILRSCHKPNSRTAFSLYRYLYTTDFNRLHAVGAVVLTILAFLFFLPISAPRLLSCVRDCWKKEADGFGCVTQLSGGSISPLQNVINGHRRFITKLRTNKQRLQVHRTDLNRLYSNRVSVLEPKICTYQRQISVHRIPARFLLVTKYRWYFIISQLTIAKRNYHWTKNQLHTTPRRWDCSGDVEI